jgi:hypothetical protein
MRSKAARGAEMASLGLVNFVVPKVEFVAEIRLSDLFVNLLTW